MPESFTSDIPARLDRLPWSGWHWRIVVALGITWVLDGLEATLVGAVGAVLGEREALGLSESQVGLAGSTYLAGAVAGALLFGRLTDLFGRRRLFLVTLSVYVLGTLATACAWGVWSFAIFRALTGAGIGGEYAAINSAIDELLPARVRGRADLAINATYWAGTALGALASIVLLDPRVLPHWLGWRMCFAVGVALGAAVFLLRRHLPESPRWLLRHGRIDEATQVVTEIEATVAHERGIDPSTLPAPGRSSQLVAGRSPTFAAIARTLLHDHPRRTILGLALMIAQAFVYNGVFFTYALVLARYYGVASGKVGLYLLPFAAGNLLGPIALGRLFDTVGRRVMIAATYGASGVLLAFAGYAFARGWLTLASQTALWCAVFFVASAAASSAYLTVSELFPVELRGIAIALFYAAGTAAGGVGAPLVFGALIQGGTRMGVFIGYLIGAGLMLIAAALAAKLGVPAEGKSLEEIAELQPAPRQV
jgi:MFS family permease